jgi:large subunit ribosomal protein L30
MMDSKNKNSQRTIRVTQLGSPIGCTESQRQTLIGLGLRRRHDVRELEDTPSVRGMVKTVGHLVSVEELA